MLLSSESLASHVCDGNTAEACCCATRFGKATVKTTRSIFLWPGRACWVVCLHVAKIWRKKGWNSSGSFLEVAESDKQPKPS